NSMDPIATAASASSVFRFECMALSLSLRRCRGTENESFQLCALAEYNIVRSFVEHEEFAASRRKTGRSFSHEVAAIDHTRLRDLL
ncbi:MAG TPA: hypothetical protein VFT01_09135, partial [Homoserinimonas sp.]|nr:hypothetical protein [Homoserinimonas sp.]